MSVDPKTQSLFDAISTVNYNRVKLLIDLGVAINSPNERGQTPLAMACQRGSLEIADLLIAAGAQMQADRGIIPESQKFEAVSSDVIFKEIPFDNLTDRLHQAAKISDTDLEVSFDRVKTQVTDESDLQSIANWQDINLDPESFLTFDLEDAFATKEIPDVMTVDLSQETFFESELTITSLMSSDPQSQQIAFQASETYAFDFSQNLDRLTANIAEQPDPLSIPMAEWEANETYVMDLDRSNLSTPAVDQSLLNSPRQGVLDSFESIRHEDREVPLVGGDNRLSVDPQMLEQIANMEHLSITDENLFPPTENWAEGETFAVDLDDLSMAELVTGLNQEIQPEQHLLADLDSSVFPVIGGEDQPQYDLETEDSGDLVRSIHQEEDDQTPNDDDHATTISLMTAVIDGDLDLVKQSIAKSRFSTTAAKAHLDRCDWNSGYTPLGMAIDRGHLNIVECLLTAGANPHCGSTSTTALGLAAERGEAEIIQLLLARRVDANSPIGADGWTALLAAIENGHRSIVQLLVTAGANVNVWSRGETPIIFAAKCEEREIYNYLYPLVNTTIRLCADRDGEHLLQATQKRRIRQQNRPVERLIEMATEGNLDGVNRAIQSGIEIDELGAKGHTALMVAAYYGHESIVKALLAAGADPNLLTDDDGFGAGMTALMLAAGSFFAHNRQQIVKLLIAGGADLNQRGVGGKTAIFYAALAGSGYRDCVEAIVTAGADLNLQDDFGHTVLTSVAATENYSMLNLLMQAGASTAGLDSVQLIQAAASGNLDRVRSLLTATVNLNLDRGAAIGNAAAAGHTQIVELLIRAGANVNLRDKLGFAPISSAAYAGYGEIVMLLIKAGADIQAPAGESQSYSALEYAHMGLYQFDIHSDRLHPQSDRQHAQIIQQLEKLIDRRLALAK